MSGLLDDQHIKEMSGSYEFYRDFHSVEQAVSFAEMLEANRIPYKLERSQTLLDAAIVGHGLVPPALIKIRSCDFTKLNEILREKVMNDPHLLDDHYLQQLDDKELIDIVRNPIDWNVEDVAVARRILSEAGHLHSEGACGTFQQKNKRRIEERQKGQPGVDRFFAFYMVFVLLGGFLINPFFLIGGIGMGWYYWQDKTIDNQGGKFYTFEKNTRFNGKVIFYIGWLSLFVGALLIFRVNIAKSLSLNQRTQHFGIVSVL